MSELPRLIYRLASDPFFIPPSASANLTEQQLSGILEMNGKERIADAGPAMSERDMHKYWAKRNKVPDWLEDRLWKERVASVPKSYQVG